jgi:LuxR family transcriptional regulator, maltose regulon positive regulatory protein
MLSAFLWGGLAASALLSRLAGQDHSMEMIKRILGSFPEDDHEPSSEASRPARGVPVLAEPLTARELEVLSLLREPLSAKQIAAGLNISYETVRRHIATIYDKLEVNRRWEAVARAEELKILPPR